MRSIRRRTLSRKKGVLLVANRRLALSGHASVNRPSLWPDRAHPALNIAALARRPPEALAYDQWGIRLPCFGAVEATTCLEV